MNQSDIWKQMVSAIQQMAEEKEKKNFIPSSKSEFWQQLTEGIKQKQNQIIESNPFSRSAMQRLVEDMRQKIEEENREKLKIFQAALDRTKNLICQLYQEIDAYVLAQELDQNMTEINTILDELSPELEKRNEIITLIKELKKSKQ